MALRVQRPRRPLLRRRGDDAASASMVSYTVAAAIFLIGSSVLLNFVTEPPGAPGQSLEQQNLKGRAGDVLDVLLGTPGYPPAWEETDPDAVARLGLVERGSSVRLDPTKFTAVAKGRFYASGEDNDAVDYLEAKSALGLEGYDFHLRAGPLLPDNADGFYGTAGMADYRIAYIGDYLAPGVPTLAAQREQAALEALDVGFVNLTRVGLADRGDVYRDEGTHLKSLLVPLLGTSVSQTAITSGSGNVYDFHRINATDFDHLVLPTLLPFSEKSLALSRENSKSEYDLGYTKGREIRAILGTANLSGELGATFTWKEYVETRSDAGDYGFLEVSPDGGATWHALTNDPATRSQDTSTSPQPASVWRDRTVSLSAANCAACLDNEDVLFAIHWVADSDSTIGNGWILDELEIASAEGTLVAKDFETPEYQLLVIGSDVDQKALTAAEVKYGIRDYVQTYGGRILVLGGDQNQQWLQPLFHAGMTWASNGLSNPDPTHPLLTTPNELDWQSYDETITDKMAWEFSGGTDDRLFDMVVGTGDDEHLLSVSRAGAFGAAEGGIILTAYLPWKLSEAERMGFLANAITFGHYHHLYLEMGPEVPTDVPVASASRTAIMEKTRDEQTEYTEMGFVLYLWRGNTTAVAELTAKPGTPRTLSATPSSGKVDLKWSAPTHLGTGTFGGHHVYRGTSPGNAVRIATVAAPQLTYSDTGRTNGVTYYYNVTAFSVENGEGPSTTTVSATPATVPGTPGTLSATGGASQVVLTWTDPLNNGGAAITGYKVFRSASKNIDVKTATPIAQTGATNTYVDGMPLGTNVSYYRIVAINGMGESPASNEVGGQALATPSAPPSVAVTPGLNNLTVAWSPASSVSALLEYHVYAGDSAASVAYLAKVTGNLTTYTETGLGHGVTRYYRVLAVNSVGPSDLSTAASGTTLRVSTAPTAFKATGDADSIILTWGPPTDPGSSVPKAYRIWRGLTSDALTVLANTTSGTNVSFVDLGLPDAATRFYQVAAVTDQGEGARTLVASAMTHDVASAPVLTLTPQVERMMLSWTVPASTGAVGEPIASYAIFRGESVGSMAHVYNATVGQNVGFVDMDVTSSKTYHYHVRAVTRAGMGSPSAIQSAAPLPQVVVLVPGI